MSQVTILDLHVGNLRSVENALRKAGASTSIVVDAAGVRGRCLIVNLPGSEKGVRESLSAVIDILPHAVELLRGRVGDHASTPREPA